MKRASTFLVLAGLGILAACGSTSTSTAVTEPPPQKIIVGATDTKLNQLLSEVYGQSLAKAGIRVARKADPIGDRATYLASLSAGDVQLVVDSTGILLTSFDAGGTVSTAKTAADQVTELKSKLPATISAGAPTTASDGMVVACTSKFTGAKSMSTLTDLGAQSENVRLAAPGDFETATPFGMKPLADTYGAEFSDILTADAAGMTDAFTKDTIDCAVLSSTSPIISDQKLVVLTDDKAMVPPDVFLPLVTTTALTPEVAAVLGTVAAKLTPTAIATLMKSVSSGTAPAVAAQGFVSQA